MSAEPYEIPSDWRWSIMGDIAEVVGGGTPKTTEPENYENGTVPWLTPADMSGYEGKYVSYGRRNITERGLRTSSARMMPAGAILFSSRAPIGYVAIAANSISTNQGFKSFVLKVDDLLPDYVYWWLKGNKALAESYASGTTFLELSGSKAKQLPIPIAPIAQQKRIVAEIEKQVSRLEEAVASLKRVKANLKRYKAAVLKAAVEGKLTENWRKQNPDVESASQLLERILAERRAKWEESELVKMKAKGKEPRNDKWKEKYLPPRSIDASDLPQIPDSWCWSEMYLWADIVDPQPSHRTPPAVDAGVPYIGIGDVNPDASIDFHGARQVDFNVLKEHRSRYDLRDGDFIFGKIGTIGRPVVLPEPYDYTLSANVVLIQPLAGCLHPRFAFHLLQSPFFELLAKRESRATTQAAFGIKKIRAAVSPIPSYAEQLEIEKSIARHFSIIESLEVSIDFLKKKAEKSRKSILGVAFSGVLNGETKDAA